MTSFELVFVGIIAASLYCFLFAIILDLIVKVDEDISLYLVLGFFGAIVFIILGTLKVLLVVN